MPVTYQGLMALEGPVKQFSYDQRDTMLYALGIGLGDDPVDRGQLAFVYEKDLKVMPSMATVIAWDDSLLFTSGLNVVKIVHGEQRLRLHRPLPAAATVRAQVRVVAAYDKGPDVGAVIVTETGIRDAADDQPLCTLQSVAFARGDGGFDGPPGGPEPLPAVPDGAADRVVETRTDPSSALLYRLSGDRNPLHCDPDVAAAAGFERPILHGLCTWGHACRAVVESFCMAAPERITGFSARFTAPVFPGETLRHELWRADGRVHFRTRATERDLVVLDRGVAELAG